VGPERVRLGPLSAVRITWVDDEITETDRTWVSTHHPGQALLHRVDARMGLTKGDYVVLDEWLRGTHEMLTSATCR
jgi:hypothetical protein